MAPHDRVRKVDVSKISIEQANSLAIQIGEKIKQITEKAVSEANHFLNIYGMNCKMQIVIEQSELVAAEAPAPTPKKQRKTRAKLQQS